MATEQEEINQLKSQLLKMERALEELKNVKASERSKETDDYKKILADEIKILKDEISALKVEKKARAKAPAEDKKRGFWEEIFGEEEPEADNGK